MFQKPVIVPIVLSIGILSQLIPAQISPPQQPQQLSLNICPTDSVLLLNSLGDPQECRPGSQPCPPFPSSNVANIPFGQSHVLVETCCFPEELTNRFFCCAGIPPNACPRIVFTGQPDPLEAFGGTEFVVKAVRESAPSQRYFAPRPFNSVQRNVPINFQFRQAN